MADARENLKNKKRGGFYWKGKRPYPSVTQILSVIDKPALRWWFGEQVYIAMLANPNISKKDALAAPYAIRDKAANRGSTVHSIIEAYKNGVKIDEKRITPDVIGYARAFYKWANMMNISVIEREKTVFSDRYGYAGTLDLLVKINGDPKLLVVDAKTGKNIYQEAFLQTAAYQYALAENGIKTDSIGVVLLNEDGGYKFEVMDNFISRFEGFLACKKIWESLNGELLKKIGYYEALK